MKQKSRQLITCIFIFTIVSFLSEVKGQLTLQQQARQILDETAVKGGLVVHIGCGDGRLTAALCQNDRYLVHGLDKDAKNLQNTRKHILSLEKYGKVSVEQLTGPYLPYTDNLVNLIVAEDLGEVTMEEVLRVLVPEGVAYLKTNNIWTKTVKPLPDDIGEWTHFLHDASNNAVAQDLQVGPPRKLKWISGPLWSRSHEFNSSLCAMVSAKGRIFYVFDEGLTGVTTESLPERWTLIARDAFNGLLLWKRPLTQWDSGAWKSRALRSVPATIPRRLVAEEDNVFITLGYDAPVSALDAATGEVLTTYKGTEGTEEIRCIKGVVILRKGKDSIMALDSKTGRKLWEATGNIQPLSLAAQGQRVFYQAGKTILCLGLKDGKQIWQTPGELPVSLLVIHDDLVLLLSKQTLQALSADTGKTIWTVDAGVRRNEFFVANNQLWHWAGNRVVGRDLRTGEIATRLNTDDVFTPGHHLRCYQSKATENFIITPNRGVEFVSIRGRENTQNDWIRGPCKYGIVPCNGLLYAPPHPCFCYPGVKLTGFNALAPMTDRDSPGHILPSAQRLWRGSDYHKAKELVPSAKHNTGDWPTYRHDSRRTGSTGFEVPSLITEQWQVPLQGRLSPPVISEGKVYVAAKDQHTLYALHVENGLKLWHFTATGRIDSPPTIYGGLVLFGCTDGRVYCLRASDGELLWRFTAAPSDQKIMAFDQLESPWRVHGSILMKEGIAYFTAGRSTYLDGGIFVFGLDPKTGKVLHEVSLDTWSRARQNAKDKPFIPGYHMEGAISDILVSEGDFIYMGQYKLDKSLEKMETPYVLADQENKTDAMGLTELMDKPFVENIETQKKDEIIQRDWQLRVWPQMARQLKEKYGGSNLGDRKMGLHVLSTSGFLDDSWFNRTFWMYSSTWPGFYIAHRAAKTGQLLVVGPDKTYAVQAYPSRNLQSPLFTPGANGYLLFSDENDNEPVIPDYTRGVPKGIGFTRSKPPVWHNWVPVRMRAMVLAGGHLFVAGPPDVVDPKDPMASFEGRAGSELLVFSKKDGNKLAQYKLESPPVFDGMAAANGRLYLSTLDNKLVCFAAK